MVCLKSNVDPTYDVLQPNRLYISLILKVNYEIKYKISNFDSFKGNIKRRLIRQKETFIMILVVKITIFKINLLIIQYYCFSLI